MLRSDGWLWASVDEEVLKDGGRLLIRNLSRKWGSEADEEASVGSSMRLESSGSLIRPNSQNEKACAPTF